MKPIVLIGLSDGEKELIEAEYKSSASYREALEKIINEKIEESLDKMREGVEKPNLTEFYADQLGYQRALQWALTLLK